MKLVFFLICCIPVIADAQVISIVYESSRFPHANPGNMTESLIKKTKVAFSNLRSYYTVKSDGEIITSTLDSIIQHCDANSMTSYSVNKLYNKAKENRWNLYIALEKWENTLDAYKVQIDNDDGKWIIDFDRTKNILGFNCFWAQDKLKPDRTIWLTLDLPYTLYPYNPLNVVGVILEYSDSSKKSIAKKVVIDEHEKVFYFSEKNYKLQKFNRYSEFQNTILSSNISNKISSNMFECKQN